MKKELFEIECEAGCTCLIDGLDELGEVLERWRPRFVSIRLAEDLSPKELLDKLEAMQRRRGKSGCGRLEVEKSKSGVA